MFNGLMLHVTNLQLSMLHKLHLYGSIFALCAIFFALLGCRSTAPQIVQQTQNIAIDTLTVRDTTHEHFTEKSYIKEIWYVDTTHGQKIKETIIYHDQQKNVDGKKQTTSAKKSTSTNLTQPVKKKSHVRSIYIVLLVFLFIIVMCLLFRWKKMFSSC